MTSKSSIYTRTGDDGETSLISGARVSKSDQRIDLYGDVDELNSLMGILISSLESYGVVKLELSFLYEVQETLFDLGANLACRSAKRESFNLSAIEDSIIKKLEKQIDSLDAGLLQLKKFILPGGSISGAYSQYARAICRRVERRMVAYGEMNETELPKNGIVFLNRLSDYLFVLARSINKDSGKKEVAHCAARDVPH